MKLRKSPSEVFLGKGVLKICRIFTGEHPGCSPVNLLHIFRPPFPKNTCGGLLLKIECLAKLDVINDVSRLLLLRQNESACFYFYFTYVRAWSVLEECQEILYISCWTNTRNIGVLYVDDNKKLCSYENRF